MEKKHNKTVTPASPTQSTSFPKVPSCLLGSCPLPCLGPTEQTPKVGDIFLCILAPNAILSGPNFPYKKLPPLGSVQVNQLLWGSSGPLTS